jgi:hypothetical protein
MTSSRLPIVSLALAFALGSAPIPLARAHAQPQPEPVATVRGFTSDPSTQTATPDDTQPGSDPAQAELLYHQARKLRDERQLRAACDTYERSLRLNPSTGTLVNLGYCHGELGHVVTAHDYYRRAEVLATLHGDTKRQEAAHENAARLAPLRATLWLQVPNEKASELEVRIDDVPQPREVWEHPMFIDAGEHSVLIRAPEHAAFRERVHVHDGVRAVLVVPDLQRMPSAPHVAAEPAPKPSTMVSPEVLALHQDRQRQQAELGAMRIAAFGVGGAGLVSLGIGLLFGQLAKNANEDSLEHCNPACNGEGKVLRDTAYEHASRATVLSIAGGVGLAAGVTLWLLAPPQGVAPGPTLALSLSANALGPELRGRY